MNYEFDPYVRPKCLLPDGCRAHQPQVDIWVSDGLLDLIQNIRSLDSFLRSLVIGGTKDTNSEELETFRPTVRDNATRSENKLSNLRREGRLCENCPWLLEG